MISMAYARNLREGFGLGWTRAGVPVEGFTHPLWTLGMLLAQIPGVPLAQRGLLVQLFSLACLLANVVVVHRLATRRLCPERPALAWLASLPTAACFALNYWALVGMETGLQALLVTLAVSLALDIAYRGRRRFVALGWVCALALLLRPDMALLVAAVAIFLLRRGRPAREERARAGAACALVACAVLGYAAFRWTYYGDWLPNTYYLKLTGGPASVRVMRGALVWWDAARAAPLTLLALPLLGLATLRSRPRHALPLAVFALYQLYAIWVGGDVWEWSGMTGNRFDAFVMPMAFALAPGIAATALARLRAAPRPGVALACLCAAQLVLAADANGLWRGTPGWRQLTLARPIFHYDLNQRVVADTLRLARQLPDARVAVMWSGIPAYFTHWETSDCLGYNDRVIAREPWYREVPLARAREFTPGHMKVDFERCVVQANADVIFQWWPEWGRSVGQRARSLGFKRYDTGTPLPVTAGQIWVRQPLSLDVAPLRLPADPDSAPRSAPERGAQ